MTTPLSRVPRVPLSRDAALLFLTRGLRLFAYGALSVVLVFYLVGVGLTPPQVGLLLTLTLAGDAVVSLALTTRADRLGRRRILLVGCGKMGQALGGGWLHKARILSGGVSLRDGRKLGRAPYVSVSCSSLHEFVLKLTSVVRALQEVARANQWPINWQPFDEHCRQAESAAKENRHAEEIGRAHV